MKLPLYLARFGASPLFEYPLHVAQLNLPSWPRIEAAFGDILERGYFSNHGPLVRRLEERLADFLQVKHVLCVTNGTVALMVLARALEIEGEVILPTFTFPATAQALLWAGLTPRLADVSPDTHMLDPRSVEQLITPDTGAILGVHLWGGTCEPLALEALAAKHELPLFFDACHGFGCTHAGRRVGGFGRAEAFSFHATKILNAMEGGAIATNDTALANRIRSIRSFHPGEDLVPVPVRMNAKMSEAQAAMALLSLDDYPGNRSVNRNLYLSYEAGLAGVPGIDLVTTTSDEESNHQYIVVRIQPKIFGLDRDALYGLLEAENVFCRKHFCPPVHGLPGFEGSRTGDSFPVATQLAQQVLQLPTGGNLPAGSVEKICELLKRINRDAETIRQTLESSSCG